MSTPARATIAIITRDRKDELRRALRSAVEQEGDHEILVLDDGSTDGTGAMVAAEFPEVRVVRYEDDADVAARRNDAADLAQAEVIVSIDDDAVFTSSRIVADTLADFDHPRLAAVAIPFVDVGVRPEVQQAAPDREERWVTTIFRATAYAVRRDAYAEIGGYTPEIRQFGEEWDLSLKLLDAGYLIRLGRSDVIHHHTSPKRDFRRMDVYQRRNEWVICWMYFPSPWHVAFALYYSLKGLVEGVRTGRALNMALGVVDGVRAVGSTRSARHPLSAASFEVDRMARARIRAGTALRLAEAEAVLGPSGPAKKPEHGGWPRPVDRLHGPLRRLRSRATAALGRPLRCEECGEELFTGLAFVWDGRLKVLGAESARVRVDWDKMNRMSFRHIDADRCRSRR